MLNWIKGWFRKKPKKQKLYASGEIVQSEHPRLDAASSLFQLDPAWATRRQNWLNYYGTFGTDALCGQIIDNQIKILALLHRMVPGKAVRAKIRFSKELEMGFQLADDGKGCDMFIELDDAKGLAGATLDATPLWSLADASAGTLTPSADGLSCHFDVGTVAGDVQVNFLGKAGGNDIAANGTITVVAGKAVSAKIMFKETS